MEGLAPVDILLHAINVLVLLVLLRLILWRPMTKFLADRAARVQSELDDADRIKAEAEAMKSEYERNIGDLEERGREILRDAQIRAGEQAKEVSDSARAKAEKLLADAKERIDAERADAVNAARHDIAQLATEMASRILRREVSLDDNISAARDFFEE